MAMISLAVTGAAAGAYMGHTRGLEAALSSQSEQARNHPHVIRSNLTYLGAAIGAVALPTLTVLLAKVSLVAAVVFGAASGTVIAMGKINEKFANRDSQANYMAEIMERYLESGQWDKFDNLKKIYKEHVSITRMRKFALIADYAIAGAITAVAVCLIPKLIMR